MRKLSVFVFLAIVAGLHALVASTVPIRGQTEASHARDTPPYHDSAPTAALPPTLDPSEFPDNRIAALTYTLAAQIKHVLYQVPCYCGCDRRDHHESLFTCYTTRHGEWCTLCQKEAIFCFREHKKGKTPAKIRAAIARGQAWKVNLDEVIREFGSPGNAAPKRSETPERSSTSQLAE